MSKRVLILEDKQDALDMLAKIVNSVAADIEIFKFSSMSGIYDVVMEHTIDLFIVDIVINADDPGDVTGLRFIDHIRTIPKYEFTPVIFTSSLMDKKMYTYSELHGFSFVDKPYKADDIKGKVEKALHYTGPENLDKNMYFRQDGVIYTVKCSEVVYAEAMHRKIVFYRKNGTSIEIAYKTCKQIIEEADYRSFVQCNRSIIVNWDYVECINMTDDFIMLQGLDNKLSIGSTYKKRISDIIKYGL